MAPPPFHLCRDVGNNLHATMAKGVASPIWQQMKELMVSRVMQFKSRGAAEELARWLDEQRQISFGELARKVYCGLDATESRPVVFVKENNLHRVLFFLLQYFPKAKFVFQVRDPRDYLVSAHGRKGNWLGNKFGSNRHALAVWREDQLGALSALAHLGSERVFFQRYEDLVSDPETVLAGLCKFLGLDFEPNMLQFHQSHEAKRLARPGGPRENLDKPLISNNFGQYRERLSRREIRMVETYLGDLMACFGYPLERGNGQAAGLFDVFWPQVMEPLERYLNGERRPYYSEGLFGDPGKMLSPLVPSYCMERKG